MHSGAVRKIPPGRRSLTGAVNVHRFKQSVQFESGLERDFIYLKSLDHQVEDIIPQPCCIQFEDGEGKSRKYTPDFLVIYSDGRSSDLVEIKYQDELKKKRKLLMPRFQAAEEYSALNYWNFSVQTEHEIRNSRLENAKLLLPLQRNKPDPGLSARIIKSISTGCMVSTEELVHLSGLRDEPASRVYRVVLGLLAHGIFTTDFENLIDQKTPVGLAGDKSW